MQLLSKGEVTPSKDKSDFLRLPVSGKYALFVASHTGYGYNELKMLKHKLKLYIQNRPTLSSSEIREIPHKLPNEPFLSPEFIEGNEVARK